MALPGLQRRIEPRAVNLVPVPRDVYYMNMIDIHSMWPFRELLVTFLA